MKRTKTLVRSCMVASFAVALGSCSDYDYGFTEKDLSSAKQFQEHYGAVDPDQDWNLAVREVVTVTTDRVSDIQIYALRSGEYQLVGDYSDVVGTQELGIDVVRGTRSLIVTDGTTGLRTQVGGAVTFGAATRAANYGTGLSDREGQATTIGVSSTGRYIDFPLEEAKAYASTLPEIDDNTKPYEETNLPKVTKNFKYISNGPFTFYPVYWQTTSVDEIGVYYTDAGGTYHEVPVYTIKSGDELQNMTRVNLTLSSNQYDEINRKNDLTEKEALEYLGFTHDAVNDVYVKKNDEGSVTYVYAGVVRAAKWKDTDGNEGPYSEEVYNQITSVAELEAWQLENVAASTPSTKGYDDSSVAMQRAKEVIVDIPVGTEFGFYLFDGNYTFYSQASKNDNYPSREGFNATSHSCYAASAIIDGNQYLCFEDWYLGDYDLNDVVLRFSSNVPTVMDEEAPQWDVLCEDLGGDFDTDYNDIVIRVEHVSGRTNATVTPLAAGGTLGDYLFYTPDNGTTYQSLGEIHQMWGVEPAVSGKYQPINVLSTSRGQSGAQSSITVDKDWSMAYYATNDFDKSKQTYGNMGGFVVKVLPKGADVPSDVKPAFDYEGFGDASIIASPDKGLTPYMICVPDFYYNIYQKDGAWWKDKVYFSWSLELVSLDVSYASTEKFTNWVADYTRDKEWYKYPIGGKTVTPLVISSTNYGDTQPTEAEDDDPAVQKESDLRVTANNVKMKQGEELDLRPYVYTSSTGERTYTVVNSYVAHMKDYSNTNSIVVAGSKGKTTVTISQAETEQYKAGETSIEVAVYEVPQMQLIHNNGSYNEYVSSFDVTLPIGGTHTFQISKGNSKGNIGTPSIVNKNANVSVTESAGIYTINAGDYIGTAAITVTLEYDEENYYSDAQSVIHVTVVPAENPNGGLPIATGQRFEYNNNGSVTKYDKASFISFDGVTATDEDVTLTVTYSTCPSTVYIDYADGTELDKDTQAAVGERTYTLTPEQQAKAIETGGIYLCAPGDATVTITKATLGGDGGGGGGTPAVDYGTEVSQIAGVTYSENGGTQGEAAYILPASVVAGKNITVTLVPISGSVELYCCGPGWENMIQSFSASPGAVESRSIDIPVSLSDTYKINFQQGTKDNATVYVKIE